MDIEKLKYIVHESFVIVFILRRYPNDVLTKILVMLSMKVIKLSMFYFNTKKSFGVARIVIKVWVCRRTNLQESSYWIVNIPQCLYNRKVMICFAWYYQLQWNCQVYFYMFPTILSLILNLFPTIFQKFPHDVPIMLSKFSISFHNFPFYIPSGVPIDISKVHNHI